MGDVNVGRRVQRKKGSKNKSLEEKVAARKEEREKIKENASKRRRLRAETKNLKKVAKKTVTRSEKSTLPTKDSLIEALDNSELQLAAKEARKKRAKKGRPTRNTQQGILAQGKIKDRNGFSKEERAQILADAIAEAQLEEKKRTAREAKRKASEAEIELARRELARRKLLHFIQKFNKKYDAGWVHEHICNQLERFTRAVENQEAPRLMIFMPPRHGKSEIASKNYPAWLLGKHPDWEIIASSYAVSLPIGFSRKVQATIQDKAYKQLFPKTQLHPKAQSAEAWMTTHEGGYVAAGVGGGITGKGAHVFIIDDPVKDAQEADSDTQRDTVWDWWGSTAKTRLAPGGGVLVIQTRWHDDDLSGRMIEQQKELTEEFNELIMQAKAKIDQATTKKARREAEDELAAYQEELSEIDAWEIIVYPAIAVEDEYVDEDGLLYHSPENTSGLRRVRKVGEALHQSRYPVGRLRNMKRSMQPRHWSALYQQNPVPDEGVYFTKDMVRFTASIPPVQDMYLFSAWDLAVGEKQQNDFSVGCVLGLDYQGQIHVVEMIRMKADIHKVAEAVVAMYKKYPSILEIGIEKGQLELSLMPQLNKILKEEKLYPTFNHDLRPITDKWVRARPLQGRMQMGTVMFPHNQTWTDNVIQELLRFPGGLHDDCVDALAWGIRMIGTRKEPPAPQEKNRKSWKDKLKYDGNRISNTPMGA